MTAAEHADKFVAENNGTYIDEDKYYGSQCWDVVAKYARVEYGCPYLPTGSGGAEGLYRLYLPPIPEYFDRVPASDLKKGDIVVWDASFYPPYGHTALVWQREGNTIFVLEQDGSKDYNGDGTADGVAYIAQRTITSKVSGGLRPKGDKMQPATFEQAQDLSQTVLLRPVPMGREEWDKYHAGAQRTFEQLYKDWAGTGEAKDGRFRANDYGRLAAENQDLKTQIASGGGEFMPTPQTYIKKTKG